MVSHREVQVQLEEVNEGKSSIIYELTEFQQAEMMFGQVNIYLVQTLWFLACINNLIKGWPETPDCLQNTLNLLPVFTWEEAQRKCLERGGPFKCSMSIQIPPLRFFLLPVKLCCNCSRPPIGVRGKLGENRPVVSAVCRSVKPNSCQSQSGAKWKHRLCPLGLLWFFRTACGSHLLRLSQLNGR